MNSLPAIETAASPVTRTDRITSIDVLRGVAVLGILVMNIQSFAMVGAAYVNPTVYGDLTGANYAVWLISHVIADRKFMTIFSLLFGAGIVLMTERREAATGRSAGVHYRRMGILLVVGLLHGYLLWYGDILHAYALCGLLVYLFRRCPPRILIPVGLISIALPSAFMLLLHYSVQYWPPEEIEQTIVWWEPTSEMIAEEVNAYQGGWLGQLPDRASNALFFQIGLFPLETFWRAGGLMLVGMALYKLGVFSAKLSKTLYAAMLLVGVMVGIPAVLYGVRRNTLADWSFEECFFGGGQFNYWASLLVACGWIGGVMLVCKTGVLQAFTRALAATGQMAFTNYLMQTIVRTTVFYGHGFGLFGTVQRTGQILIVLSVWTFQLISSPWWLARFRFGPAEWAWRCLTYGQRQPLRRVASTDK
jgi:uncharacterized protein